MMEKCQYEEVIGDNDDRRYEDKTMSWKPFLRQLMVCSGVWTCYFQSGLCFGAPTVLIPQVRAAANSSSAVSEEMASWLSSAYNLGAFPWIIILPLAARKFGRKLCFIIVCLNTLSGFMVFYCSTTIALLLFSQAMLGVLNACTVTLLLMIVTEYTSPRHRGIFLTLKTATFGWGLWVSNAVGTFFHWKIIDLLGIVCSVYTLATVALWPESPYWLAGKGRLDECADAHHWLKGFGKDSEKELQSIIDSQKAVCTKPKLSLRIQIKNAYNLISSKEFYKPILLCMLILAQYNFSGKSICSIYSLEIIKKVTKSESTAYAGMLLLDGITVLGTYSGCILTKFFKRRTLLLTTSVIGITFLFLISLYLFLVRSLFINENKCISVLLLIAFSITISCGPMILATSLCGELMPLKSRTLSIIFIGSTGNLLLGVLVKMSPYIFNTIKLHGAFLFYGISTSICTVFIYKYLPETKDKTLQEIENALNGVTVFNDEVKELMCKTAETKC